MITFTLDKHQVAKATAWMKAQYEKNDSQHGAIGGRFTFSFTDTSLGQIATVKDGATNEELNLTDFSDW